MYTNVNAIKRNLTYCGNQFRGCFYFVPTAGLVNCGLSISTIGDYIGCGVLSDSSAITDPDEFIEIFVQKYTDALAFTYKTESSKKNA